MNPDKLRTLLRNIRNLKYPQRALSDVDAFGAALASDLSTSRDEAMALLGYLLARDYARIIPGMGLVVNPANEEIQSLVDSGALDQEAQS